MTNRQLERCAAAGGIVGTLLSLTYVLMPPHGGDYPYTRRAIGEMARNHEAYLFKNLLGTLSFFCFLFFLGSLYSTLRKAEGGPGGCRCWRWAEVWSSRPSTHSKLWFPTLWPGTWRTTAILRL